jgi:S-adenosylmethionine synthetase
MRDFVLTSESVTAGHPDKLCDQISDAVIDAYLAAGVRTPVSAECAIATGIVFLSVRSREDSPVDPAALARRVIEEAGYPPGADQDGPTIMLDLARTASNPELPAGVATHMTTAFGHACRHTPADLAYPIWAAHRLTRELDRARRDGRLPWLHADAQAQVAVEFRGRDASRITAVAITAASPAARQREAVADALLRDVIHPVFDGCDLAPDEDSRLIFIAGPREGGPTAHSGLTGRKLGDDGYGGLVRQSTSAMSGKSPDRIDRIASYAARHAARCVVAAGLAAECEVQLSYLVGDAAPVTVEVDTFGSGRVDDGLISKRLHEVFDFRVGAILERFSLWDLPRLRQGRFYRDLATYGHMGRDDLGAPWEDTEDARRLA